MSQRLVAVVGRNNTQAEVTGQNELLVKVGSIGAIGLATEATLQQVLSAVDNMRDYEVRLVEDSTTPTKVTWLEVRYWDAQSGALGTPQYYLPGSTTPGSPVLPISYINNQSVLTQILSTLTQAVRTPNLLRATGSGTIAPIVYDFSVSNVGSANGTILGGTIKPGETLNFAAGSLNNYYTANSISYDGTGTELVIVYNS